MVKLSEFGSPRLRPRNNRIGLIGHSLNDYTYTNVAPVVAYNGRGWTTMLNRQVGQRLRFLAEDDVSQAGTRTDEIWANQIAAAIASPADLFVALLYRNDVTQNYSAAWSIDYGGRIIDALIGAGKIVIVGTPAPKGSTTTFSAALDTTAQTRNIHQIRQWLFARERVKPGLIVLDQTQLMQDPASNTGGYRDEDTNDNTHHTIKGGWRLAQGMAPIFTQLYPPVGVVSAPSDLYDATNNPNGNTCPNPCMLGTGGTTATNASGTVADNTIVDSQVSDLTAVASIYTDANSRRWQRMVLSGNSANSNPRPRIRQDPSSVGSIVAGATYELVIEYSLAAGHAGVRQIAALLELTGSSGATYTQAIDGDAGASNYGALPAGAHTGIVRTPRFTIPAGVTFSGVRASLMLHCIQGVAVTATLDACNFSLRRVLDL